jgi:excisionase family DNA binding protein
MFVPLNNVIKELGLSKNTVRQLADRGVIRTYRTEGGQRRFDLQSVREYIRGEQEAQKRGQSILYCRVSSAKQKDDLERQIQFLRALFPEHRVISDIGSGINFKRPGLKTILELAMQGNLTELVVAHRDRLSRFCFDLIEWIITRNGGRVIVKDEDDGQQHSPEAELTEDLLSIITVFSCRIQGRRRYNNRKRKAEDDESKDLPHKKATTVVHQDPAQHQGPP